MKNKSHFKGLVLLCGIWLISQCVEGFPQDDGDGDEDAVVAAAVTPVAPTLSPAQIVGQVDSTFKLVTGILNSVFCNQWFGVRLCPSLSDPGGPSLLTGGVGQVATAKPQNATKIN